MSADFPNPLHSDQEAFRMTETTSGLKPGQMVPDFEIETYDPVKDDFGTLSLANQKKAGRWTVLFFYPADFTFVCATEFAALAEQQDKFREMGCDIVTVSTDTKFVHLAWRKSEKELGQVRYAMGADRTATLSRMFGIYNEGNGLALRGTFIISPDGKLMNTEVNFYNLGRNIDELMRKVKANIYLAKQTGEVCPAKWTTAGDKTLVNPGARMVGKVHEALKG
jgi:NADH-dependent peroxiredoxin subunit C